MGGEGGGGVSAESVWWEMGEALGLSGRSAQVMG